MSRFGSQIGDNSGDGTSSNAPSMGSNPVETAKEFKEMVRNLHAAGIEVILDVVYNHTAEGTKKLPGPHATLIKKKKKTAKELS